MLKRIAPVARYAYAIVSWLFVASVVTQVFFAGYGILVKFGHWDLHVHFARLLIWPLLAMILFSLLGRLPRRTVLISIVLSALYVLQYLLIYLPGDFGLPILRALHPVNALAIFFAAVHNARRYRQHLAGE